MNYSQRKHLERMIAPNVQAQFDPFGLQSPFNTFAGLRIVESPDVPRYTLPAEVIPGVPWPPGFRDEINRWSRAFIGTTNAVPRGQAYVIAGHTVVMRPEDVVRISNIC
jgi:hypothetical protein